jgi:diguanylate cyclase (GGDEF)-like protein
MPGPASNQSPTPPLLEQQVRQRLETLAYLPTTVAVAMKFIELGKQAEPDPAEYAKIIGSDPSLSAKVLALANSSWFGIRNRVTRPQMAINLLGLGTVRTLAITYCLTGLHSDLKLTPEESRMFWSASLCKAVAAKHYASHFDPPLCEEAFACGLFQDFAIPVMFSAARDKLFPLLQDANVDCESRLQKEREIYRLDHAEIGRMVAQKLELPDMFVDAVAFHHDRERLKQFSGSLVLADAVYLSSLFPHLLNGWNRQDAEQIRAFLASRNGAETLDVDQFLEGVQEEFDQLYAYFENGKHHESKLAELLGLATREAADNTMRLMGTVHEMLRDSLHNGMLAHEIMDKQSRLEQTATQDSLTGAWNRQGFDLRTRELMTRASRYGVGIGVCYLDLDRFKLLNDTFGHNAGDAALKKLVAVAREVFRPGDVLGRLGGEEFALVITDCAEEDATRMVQTLVQKLAQESVIKAEKPVRASVSAGLVWVPGRTPCPPLDSLLVQADQLMYAAKRAGGNRLHTARATATGAA